MKPRILFLCKKSTCCYGMPAGLFNSAQFMVNALTLEGYEAKLEFAIDANCIDRLVTEYDPTRVVIEALWVTPDKMDELMRILEHARRQWIVRIHSKIPFLAQEGMAIDWIRNYDNRIVIAPNSKALADDLKKTMKTGAVLLPNVYRPFFFGAPRFDMKLFEDKREYVDIGCFGAVRPLKNQLQQAVAAIEFCDQKNLLLRFHINGGRVEDRGQEALKNLRALFLGTTHELVEHDWLSHRQFLALVWQMDLGMQVSLSESFNIVTADFVHVGVPIVVSEDVEWMPSIFKCEATSTKSIVSALRRAWFLRKFGIHHACFGWLERHNAKALKCWKKFLK